jgi:hypothetical protein
MPRIRSPVSTKKKATMDILGLHFGRSARQPVNRKISTIIPSHETADHPRFPAVEHVLGTGRLTHECLVTFADDTQRLRKFVIFFQYDEHSRINRAVRAVVPGATWKGEILVMKQGVHERCFVTALVGKVDRDYAVLAVRHFLTVARVRLRLSAMCDEGPVFPKHIEV